MTLPRPIATSLALLAASYICFASSAAQQTPGTTIPWIEVPEHLRPYTDLNKILLSGREAIKLATTFKIETETQLIKPACRKGEILSVYRGTILALGVYKGFVNSVEIGWPSMERSIPGYASTNLPSDYSAGEPALPHSSRHLLFNFWPPERLTETLQLLADLKHLPADVRADLRSFILFVRDAEPWAEALRTRALSRWSIALRTQSPNYRLVRRQELESEQARAKLEKRGFNQATFDAVWPDGEGTTISALFRTIHSTVRGPTETGINPCFDDTGELRIESTGGNVFRAWFGNDQQLEIFTWVGPTKYAILFWHRRYSEGSSVLARHILARLINALGD